jgi:hypothetical protein
VQNTKFKKLEDFHGLTFFLIKLVQPETLTSLRGKSQEIFCLTLMTILHHSPGHEPILLPVCNFYNGLILTLN